MSDHAHQQLQVAAAGWGMVVIDPPRALATHHAIVDRQCGGWGEIVDDPHPAARTIIEIFDIRRHRQSPKALLIVLSYHYNIWCGVK